MGDMLHFIAEWLNSGSYGFITEAFAYLIEVATLAAIKFMLWAIPFAWGIAKQILEDIGLSQAINQAWGSLDSATLQTVSFFQIPAAVNNILTAAVTKMALRYVPGW